VKDKKQKQQKTTVDID